MARARNYRIATGTSVTMVDTEACEMDDFRVSGMASHRLLHRQSEQA
jgi:hypothetical protein